MPPKKTSKGSMVGVYDVEIMNDEELKAYITALKEEHERMRSAFSGHPQEKGYVTGLLQITQENILNRYEALIQKEIELQRLQSESNDALKAEDVKNMIIELTTNEAIAKDKFIIFGKVDKANAIHDNTDQQLKDNLKHIKREVENTHFAHRFLFVDLKEEKEEQHARLWKDKEGDLTSISEEYVEKYRDASYNFYSDKIKTMTKVWEEIMDENICENSLAEQAEKMCTYFKEIFWKNIKASTNLKERVEHLEKKLYKLKIRLKSIELENKILLEKAERKTVSPNNDVSQNVPSYAADTSYVQLEDVTYENDVLIEKLRQVMVERNALKNRFILDLRRIYRKADFAGYLAEKMLRSLQDPQIKGSVAPTLKTYRVSSEQNNQTRPIISQDPETEVSRQENSNWRSSPFL